MTQTIQEYNNLLEPLDKAICDILAGIIDQNLPSSTSKIWHRHPVWFLDENPVVGYAKQKKGIMLMFWSGQSFGEPSLIANGSFKAAQMFFNSVEEINLEELQKLLDKAQSTQWDYKNIVKRKGVLEKLTEFTES